MSSSYCCCWQIHLASEFQKLFEKYKIKTGQILLVLMIQSKEEEL